MRRIPPRGSLIACCIFAACLFTVCAGLPVCASEDNESSFTAVAVADNAMVVSCHGLATKAGIEILKAGGTAVDAFIAVTLVEYVMTPGASSISGPLGLMVYDAQAGETHYLDAFFNQVISPAGRWDPTNQVAGKKILVPGAPAGLYEAWKKFGKLDFSSLVAPAVKIAAEGFPLFYEYDLILASREELLAQSDYGRSTFFNDGEIFQEGDVLVQPRLAETLAGYAEHGAEYMYTGAWGQSFVETVRELGGDISMLDMLLYYPVWKEPLTIDYRGYEIHASAPPAYGGIKTLMALKILENTDPTQLGHMSDSADALALMFRAARAVEYDYLLYYAANLDIPLFTDWIISEGHAQELWQNLDTGNAAQPPSAARGSHSHHVIVIDSRGNIASGTHTINAYPWGDGVFVGGVALNNAAPINFFPMWNGRFINPLSTHIVFHDGEPYIADGVFGASMYPADFQVISNILDYDMGLEEAMEKPRLGMRQVDITTGILSDMYMIDRRFPEEMITEMEEHGIYFTREGYIDTGWCMFTVIDPDDGRIYGRPTIWYSNGLAEGY